MAAGAVHSSAALDERTSALRRSNELLAASCSFVRRVWAGETGSSDWFQAAASAPRMSLGRCRVISKHGQGRGPGGLRAALCTATILVLSTMGASASLERVAFAPLLSGSLPPQLGRLRSTGECGSLGRSVCRAPPLGAAMSADGGDGGNDRLLGSRRLARALSSLQTPTEQLAEDDQKILWSRRIARAVESFSSEAPVPHASALF